MLSAAAWPNWYTDYVMDAENQAVAQNDDCSFIKV